jgi:GNAT superfamily N-acetyltransferase
VVPGPSVRPLEAADIDAVHQVTVAAFEDLNRRFNEPPEPPGPIAASRIRLGRLLATDPGGAWVAEQNGSVVGCSLAIVRDGVWGLSLLVVSPGAQSTGVGRELLSRAWEHGRDARGWIILASRDARALRSYARLGLRVHPALAARGRPRRVTAPPDVRSGTLEDLPLTVVVDRAVRGAAHGEDLVALL